MQPQALGEEQDRLRMTDRFQLFIRHWTAQGQAERAVVFLHGIEVHSGAFKFMGSELAAEGCEVYGFDRRGFGNSKEEDLPRGDIHSFERHLEDINEVIEFVHKTLPNKPLFLFGHSIGTAYALWYAANTPQLLDGLILAAPPVKSGFKIPAGDTLKVALASNVQSHGMYDLIDHWPKDFLESEEYKLLTQDELCTKTFGLGYLYEVQTKLANKMSQNASEVGLPTLLLHGDSDIIALPESSKILLSKLVSNDKNLHTFTRADHWFYQSIIPTMTEKYSLEQKRKVSTKVKDWLKSH